MTNTISGHGFTIQEPEYTSTIELDEELMKQKFKEFELVINKIRWRGPVIVFFDGKRMTKRKPLMGKQIVKRLKRKSFKGLIVR